MPVTIRPADLGDVNNINELANWYIENTAANFDTRPWDYARRREWLDGFQTPYHCLVADVDGCFAGFACNTRFRPKAAYDSSTETTVYVKSDFQGIGVGGSLYSDLLNRVSGENFHRAYAVITLPNPTSLKLHQSLGYRAVGTFDEIGLKFNRYHSVTMLEKKL